MLPYAGEPHASEPRAREPHPTEPHPTEPLPGDSSPSDLHAGDPDPTGLFDGEPALRQFSGEIRELGSRWLDSVLSDPAVAAAGGDAVCSPAGLWLALAAVGCGAQGDTADELADLTGLAGPEAAPVVTAVARELAATDALAAATGVWTRVPLRASLVEALPDVAFGPLRDPAAIDAWVARETAGLIGALPFRPGPATLLVLVNALALQARWARPFAPERTRDAPFRTAQGTEATVRMMSADVPVGDVWTIGAHGGDVHVVELACAGENPALVRFALGPEGMPPAPVMSAAWAPRRAGTPAPYRRAAVRIPRFGLRTVLDVTAHLPALGITAAADPRTADFGGLAEGGADEEFFVDRVGQETLLRVAEEGVEAAAATWVATRGGAPAAPPSFLELVYDRPFACAVMDASGTVPLFAAYQATAPDPGENPARA
ncbi:serpin family protein [Yinghuangia soli]|uniref:Serpin domain-containing protein n=1 Tax=Yinghuangia soli TaxID=2908204 RepID=A0AA41PXF9_9ACTN|nr:serpin family protein [Yinghuangia soli]MCF2527523.1 hypothetical protein [Yinghuangia soli]